MPCFLSHHTFHFDHLMHVNQLTGSRCDTRERLSAHSTVARLSLQVTEMMTTWEGEVEAAAVALVIEGGGGRDQPVSEMDPPEERQTSGNRLKVTPRPVCQTVMYLFVTVWSVSFHKCQK